MSEEKYVVIDGEVFKAGKPYEEENEITWKWLVPPNPRTTFESTLKHKHTVTVIDVDVPNWEMHKNPMGYADGLRRAFEGRGISVEDIPGWNELRERFVKSCEEMKEYYEGGEKK
jgi:hypothetical protein